MIPLKLSQALTGFFLRLQTRKLSLHTIQDCENTLVTKFQTFLERDYLVEEITSRHIEEFMAAQTAVSKKTALNYHTGLSAFWTWASTDFVTRSRSSTSGMGEIRTPCNGYLAIAHWIW